MEKLYNRWPARPKQGSQVTILEAFAKVNLAQFPSLFVSGVRKDFWDSGNIGQSLTGTSPVTIPEAFAKVNLALNPSRL